MIVVYGERLRALGTLDEGGVGRAPRTRAIQSYPKLVKIRFSSTHVMVLVTVGPDVTTLIG